MKWLMLVGCLLLEGCVITEADRQFVREFLANTSGCVHIQGSGGGGMLPVPGVVPGGGFGQGSLSAARSVDGQQVKCSASEAEVFNDRAIE